MPLVLSDVRLVTLKAMGQHRDHVNTRAKVGFYPRDVRLVFVGRVRPGGGGSARRIPLRAALVW